MGFITVKSGGPDIPEGSYPVILTAISDPKTVLAQRGPNAGKEIDLLDWTFAIDAPNTQYDGLEITATTSTASGPKSKLYGYLTALFDGVPPAVGTSLEKAHLIGRRALAQVTKDPDGGWLRIGGLIALPATMRAPQPVGTPAPAPVVAPVPVPQPASAAPAAEAALPF